jgi:hypothetical protein
MVANLGQQAGRSLSPAHVIDRAAATGVEPDASTTAEDVVMLRSLLLDAQPAEPLARRWLSQASGRVQLIDRRQGRRLVRVYAKAVL